MKKSIFTFLFLIGAASMFQVQAIHPAPMPAEIDLTAMTSAITVNDFLAVDIKGYRTADGKKMKWTQRMALGMTQKKMARQVRKGKIDGEASMSTALAARSANTYGLLSVILSVAGLVVPYLGIAMILAGLVLGIIGISRDPNPTLAIIGTVISSVFLFLVLIVIVAVASGSWFWF